MEVIKDNAKIVMWNPRYECRKLFRLIELLKSGYKLVVFDTETTGTKISDEIIQFSGIIYMMKDTKLRTVKYMDVYIKAKRPIDKKASEVNHITDEFLLDKEPAETVAPRIRDFFGDMKKTIFVGYNVEFDIKMLNHMFMLTIGDSFEPDDELVVDVMKMSMEEIARDNLKGLDNVDPDDPEALKILKDGHFKQENCAKYYGIGTEGAHSSLVDIQICAKLMSRLMKQFREETNNGMDLETEANLPKLDIMSMQEQKFSKENNFVSFFVESESGEKGYIRYSRWNKVWEEKLDKDENGGYKKEKFIGHCNMTDFHKRAMQMMMKDKKKKKATK